MKRLSIRVPAPLMKWNAARGLSSLNVSAAAMAKS
jgi:hypothetical protein